MSWRAFCNKKILNRIFEAGAAPAGPGEFTYRAFHNKKIDLTKAEAIQKIISAKNDQALTSAEKQLEGVLFEKIDFFQKELIEITAIVEASIDFPEDDLEFSTHLALEKRLEKLISQMQLLENTFHLGKIAHEGLTLCLCGPVNVGKSSLLNALLQKDRAIVTDIAGTTRDLLEEELYLKNFHLKAIDTAGIRETKNLVEKEGIKRSKKAIQEADLVLCVLDAEKGYTEESKEILQYLPEDKSIIVWNKIDIKEPPVFSTTKPIANISAKENKGILNLCDLIEKYIIGSDIEKDEVVLSEQRHKNALHLAIKSCLLAKNALRIEESPEFISSDLQEALRALASIIGIDVTEDLLDSIFSQFCLGK